MLFVFMPIVLAAAGIKLKPWPGVLLLSVFLILVALLPVVFTATGIELTRNRTLIAVACMSIGATLILRSASIWASVRWWQEVSLPQ